ncbi:hypothetical protein P8452_08626 [Trifolium repens]|nr:hypothetical protein P8452_08626 [Trifolium repens]
MGLADYYRKFIEVLSRIALPFTQPTPKELNMRHRRWSKFLKEYDFELSYHSDKANVVVDALSRKTLHMSALMVKEFELLEQFRDMSLVYELAPQSVMLGMLKINSEFLSSIKEA